MNNLELVNKIESVTIPKNAKFASFDIINMYSNIPITIKIIRDHLIENRFGQNKIDIITKQNYFQYDNEFYTQVDGLPMGSPLSGIMANIFLNHFEKTFIHNARNKLRNNIIYWYRYVDDIILLFDGTDRQLSNLHNYLNSIHQNIQFTLEKEMNNSINFLDLTITNKNQQHFFKIFRKPTQTNHTIHASSNHPFQHKISAYNHMLERLNKIPMTQADYIDELHTIIDIAHANGYHENLIHKINKKIKYKQTRLNLSTLSNREKNMTKYISLQYNKNTSNVARKIMRHHGYTIAHKTNNTIAKNLREHNNTNTLDSGIYKLSCNDCNDFYIGQTGRSFIQRFKEHTMEINHTHPKSNYAQHLKVNNHTYTDIENNLSIIHRMRKSTMMDRREEYEIYINRNNPHILNDKINSKTNRIYDLIQKMNSVEE